MRYDGTANSAYSFVSNSCVIWERTLGVDVKQSLSQVRRYLSAPGFIEIVLAFILTALDVLAMRTDGPELMLVIIGGLQVVLVAVAVYLPIFAVVVVPANFLAFAFLPAEQAPLQIFCVLLIVEVMRAQDNKIPAQITTLLLWVISNYDVPTRTFARDSTATFVTTLLFLIAYTIGFMRARYQHQRAEATQEANKALEQQRLKLATVLHDSTAKSFTRVTMLAQSLAIEREGTDEKLENSLEDIAETSREGLLQLRQLLSLLKSADDDSSLSSAIGQDERVPSMSKVLSQAKDELEEAGFAVSLVELLDTEPSLSQVSEVIAPSLSEICTNIQKYGEPNSTVYILATGDKDDGFSLTISNQISNSRQNLLPRAMLSSGLGLGSLRRRTRPWSGTIDSEREGEVWTTRLHLPSPHSK